MPSYHHRVQPIIFYRMQTVPSVNWMSSTCHGSMVFLYRVDLCELSCASNCSKTRWTTTSLKLDNPQWTEASLGYSGICSNARLTTTMKPLPCHILNQIDGCRANRQQRLLWKHFPCRNHTSLWRFCSNSIPTLQMMSCWTDETR
jgi:hypothetical protein